MHLVDWLFIILPLVIVLTIALVTHRYLKSVAGFLSGGRVAGRYLLAVARGEMQAGAVVFVAMFELYSKAGFTTLWWGWISIPVTIIVGISGFVTYRYRETRAMTLAQFFELRYSRGFRLFSGVLGFLAGILNFGIIPAVGARFFVYFWRLPESFPLLSFNIPTYVPLMGLFLLISLTLTLGGGLITLMLTDCLEGLISQVFYIAIVIGLITVFSWSEIEQALGNRPPGQSMLNPFDSLGIQDFNIWFVLMTLFVTVYGTMAWQNSSAYNSAALNAHESRMGLVLGRWREFGKVVVVTLLAICAVTYLQHPDFAGASAPAASAIGRISDINIQQQMRVPVALSYFLPVGIKGMLCAVLLMGVFGGDSTHLHSWGSIFVQDVILPLRKKIPTPAEHIRLLRISIISVACFAFLFGALFQQTQYIIMWFSVTTAIYVGGAGSAIIGGLYWNRGTAAGAWAAVLAGSVLSGGGIMAKQIWPGFPLNGMQVSFYSTLIAIAAYAGVSLLTCRERFDLNRMLHRTPDGGPVRGDAEDGMASAPGGRRVGLLARIIGIDENFDKGDKWIAGGLFGWSIFWFLVFVAGSIWNLIAPWPEAVWSTYWQITGIGLPIMLSIITAVWFTWGAWHNIKDLFRRLNMAKGNPLDNGMVSGHRNLDEAG
jgi:SSS family solute:Na+ symporter